MKIPFVKYQGLGNDFIIVDGRDHLQLADHVEQSNIAIALCDRHIGIGADGVLTVRNSEKADATMRVTNADGSLAEMCGNGIRCVARYLWETDPRLQKECLTIATGGGNLKCRIDSKADEFMSTSVDMGIPKFEQTNIPALFKEASNERVIESPLRVKGRMTAVTSMSLGNPHAVIFAHQRGNALKALAEELGPLIETHSNFPNRTNVEFVHQVDSTHLEVYVWERACGLTQACGTGACASAIAACVLDKSPFETELSVLLPGGALSIRVSSNNYAVSMRGPAKKVFEGSVETDVN